MITTTGLHPFEQSGLGIAPFSYVGMNELVQRLPDGSTRAAGTCDHCGACIRYAFGIKSSDDKVSHVGSDCICKLNREDNRFIGEVEAEVRKIKKASAQAATKIRKAKDSARVAEMLAKIEDASGSLRSTLAALPHPRGFAGLTLLDYVVWMKKNAGLSGMLGVCKLVEKVC